ncbi:hypothetical protein [Propionicimonas sp.]|uniref:hypothetical protein n=1 Tax=Propionicimonas sp. TaxID=1955623 RepID=UPI0039E3209E
MDLADFYTLMSVTCFTLVGLWWTVIERHSEWKVDPGRRKLAGGVYLSFLLPGLMSTFAQVDAGNPLVWRSSFAVAAVVGLLTTLRLVSVDRSGTRGPFRRFRWIVAVVYLLILLIAVAPPVAGVIGATPLQAASVALILLVVMGHGLTWEFMMEPDPASGAPAGPA